MQNNLKRKTPSGGDYKQRNPNNKEKWYPGQPVVCAISATQFYKEGEVYLVEVNKEGKYGVRGSDGLFDRFEDMISTFKPKEGYK